MRYGSHTKELDELATAEARIAQLEAALRKVLIIYGDERGDGAEGDAISAARACFPVETKVDQSTKGE